MVGSALVPSTAAAMVARGAMAALVATLSPDGRSVAALGELRYIVSAGRLATRMLSFGVHLRIAAILCVSV